MPRLDAYANLGANPLADGYHGDYATPTQDNTMPNGDAHHDASRLPCGWSVPDPQLRVPGYRPLALWLHRTQDGSLRHGLPNWLS